MTYRFVGRLLQDGKQQLYVSKGDTPVAIKQGDSLDGYVVESITSGEIALVYPSLGHKVKIAIPVIVTSSGAGSINSSMATTRSELGSLPAREALSQPSTAPAAATTPAPAPAAGGTARVRWEGPGQVMVGSTFSVSLRVVADQPISRTPLQVRFDPALLESVAVRPGKLYASDSASEFTYQVNPGGSISVRAATQATPTVGAAELLILTFKPLKPAASAEVSLTTLNLQGTAGRAVAHDTLATYRASITP